MSASASLLRVDIALRDGWTVVTVAGELDFATCAELTARLDEIIGGQQPARLAVDLSGLEFSDSSGLRCLVIARRQVMRAGSDLVLLRPPDLLRWKLRATSLDQLFHVADELPG
jgi:anti-anti-sigma factor